LICYFFSWFQVFTKKAKALLATALVLLCAIAMFCKVCFDASKSDYKTHNVRDSASNVVCPLLLNTKCRTCGYFGHTTKYCKSAGNPVVATKAYVRPLRVVVQVQVPVSVPLKRGAFACLDEEICEDACDDNVSPTGVEACVAEACVAEACVAEEMDFDKDTIIWGVGLKSMIGKRWADVVGC
jgi:hypothetical protein